MEQASPSQRSRHSALPQATTVIPVQSPTGINSVCQGGRISWPLKPYSASYDWPLPSSWTPMLMFTGWKITWLRPMPSWLQWRRAKLKIKPSGSKVNSLTALCNVTSLGSFSSPTFHPALAALPCLLQICPILLSHSSHIELVPLLLLYTVVAQPKPASWVGSSRKLRAGLTRLSTKDFSHLAHRWLEEKVDEESKVLGNTSCLQRLLLSWVCSLERCPLQTNKSVEVALTKENFLIQVNIWACDQLVLEGVWGAWILYGYGRKIWSLPWAGSRAEHREPPDYQSTVHSVNCAGVYLQRSQKSGSKYINISSPCLTPACWKCLLISKQ